jgi:hypothetical protein
MPTQLRIQLARCVRSSCMADAREIQGRASPQPAQLFARKRAPTSAVPSACRSPLAGDARATGQGSTAGKPSACLRSSGFSSPAASGSSCMADAREIQGRASPQPAQLFARKRAPTSAAPSACRSPLAGDTRATGQGSTAGKPSTCLVSSAQMLLVFMVLDQTFQTGQGLQWSLGNPFFRGAAGGEHGEPDQQLGGTRGARARLQPPADLIESNQGGTAGVGAQALGEFVGPGVEDALEQLVVQLDVMDDTAAQEGVGQAPLAVAGDDDDRRRQMLGAGEWARPAGRGGRSGSRPIPAAGRWGSRAGPCRSRRSAARIRLVLIGLPELAGLQVARVGAQRNGRGCRPRAFAPRRGRRRAGRRPRRSRSAGRGRCCRSGPGSGTAGCRSSGQEIGHLGLAGAGVAGEQQRERGRRWRR